MFFSRNHGGIAPRPYFERAIAVRCFMARANGRAAVYVTSDIGAPESGGWQNWQLRCRIGMMCLLNVTGPAAGCAAAGAAVCAAAGTANKTHMATSPERLRRQRRSHALQAPTIAHLHPTSLVGPD